MPSSEPCVQFAAWGYRQRRFEKPTLKQEASLGELKKFLAHLANIGWHSDIPGCPKGEKRRTAWTATQFTAGGAPRGFGPNGTPLDYPSIFAVQLVHHYWRPPRTCEFGIALWNSFQHAFAVSIAGPNTWSFAFRSQRRTSRKYSVSNACAVSLKTRARRRLNTSVFDPTNRQVTTRHLRCHA
jgi:hypothetical protein